MNRPPYPSSVAELARPVRLPALPLSAALLLLATPALQAADLPQTRFSHGDWELACDNTRTCRAAGYSPDGVELSVSVLLTRQAGPDQPVTGQVKIGRYGDNPVVDALPRRFRLNLQINGQAYGAVAFDSDSLLGSLDATQVNALLAALTRKSRLEFVRNGHVWALSDSGAAAALLKMDEFQGRLGTPGAIIRRGKQPESGVLPMLPGLNVKPGPLASARAGDKDWVKQQGPALLKALRATLRNEETDYCPDLTEPDPSFQEAPTAARLTDTRLLVATRCWSGAYNVGYGYWIVNQAAPYQPELVTTSGSEYQAGVLSATQKGRGLGDCWSSDEWQWDGKHFVLTHSTTTGMCRLIEPGGAWDLPTRVRRGGGE